MLNKRVKKSLNATIMAVALLLCVGSQHTEDTQASVVCPLLLQPNHTARCKCTEIFEIHCRGLDAIPAFTRDEMTYAAIYMAHQNVRELPQGSFLELSVKKIVLNLNPIGDRISMNVFAGLEFVLEELELGGCGVRSLPPRMLNRLDALRRLHLWRNRIESIPPGFFRDTPNLIDLILWGNRIEEIADDTFEGLHSIRRIDLDRNRITVLSRIAFRRLRTLEVLYIGENNVLTLHADTFSHLSSLKVLNVDHNGMGYIYPKAFNGLDRLLSLSLNDNRIGFLPEGIFANLFNLTVLSLQGNMLENVWSMTFNGLLSLQTLNLSRNRLTNLQEGVFRQSSRLIRLGLDDNQLRTIERCTLSPDTRLRSISLIGNPVACECRLAWLSKKSASNPHKTPVDTGASVWGSCRHKDEVAEVSAKPLRAIDNVLSYRDSSCFRLRYDC